MVGVGTMDRVPINKVLRLVLAADPTTHEASSGSSATREIMVIAVNYQEYVETVSHQMLWCYMASRVHHLIRLLFH